MEYLYAPWRSGYVTKNDKERDGCVFCAISKEYGEDEANRVLYRDDICFCVINRYPYTPGHFMIIPHLHIKELGLLPKEQWLHISDLAQEGVGILKEFGAEGVNMGMNLEGAAGAGIPGHIHMHLLPRWRGDTNFITSIGDNRVYGVDFDQIYQKLKALFEKRLG